MGLLDGGPNEDGEFSNKPKPTRKIKIMGYRSEVCIGLTDDAARLFRTILDHLPEHHELRQLVKDAHTSRNHHPWGEEHKTEDKDCEDKLYWDGVKWYDGFEDVDFIEAFITDCIPEEDYKFVRIGEETDDVDERGDYWDAEIYVQRSISW